jgi:hypothetical protein
MSYKEIMEGIQSTINSNVRRDKKPILLGVSKPTMEGTVRIWCETEDEANLLWDINWETATKGFQAQKPKFGIVIHGVNKDDFNTAIDNNKSTIERIEKGNTLPIAKVAPLRQKPNETSPKHSIVIFTTDAHAADRCIKHGIYMDYRLYPAERYTPQLEITQCFNCGKFDHRASQCRQTYKTSGKCGENHPTMEECKGPPNCSNGHSDHENWHHECPTRIDC